MATESPGFANQDATYAAATTRRAVFSHYASAGGVIGTNDLLVTTTSLLNVSVATGQAIVPNSTSNGGPYYIDAPTSTTLTCGTANGTNPRIDTVCLTQYDKYEGAGNDSSVLQIIAGTATPGATLSNLTGAGTIPQTSGASSLLICYILVPAGATSLNSGDLQDERSYAKIESNAAVVSFNGRFGGVAPGAADYLAVAYGGLTGATAATRYAGGTASGAPVSGTFALGDFVIDQTGTVWVCTGAGSPGTWTSIVSSAPYLVGSTSQSTGNSSNATYSDQNGGLYTISYSRGTWTTGNNGFEVPSAGLYLVLSGAQMGGSEAGLGCQVWKNGGHWTADTPVWLNDSTGMQLTGAQAIVPCAAGDYLNTAATQNSGSTMGITYLINIVKLSN